jgi:phosphatidate cytidylyltransferase
MPEGLFLLMLTVMVSDTAQYYSGRTFGRTPLAPAISPKKTIEGAIGGFVFGMLLMAVAGHWWMPNVAWRIGTMLGGMSIVLVALAAPPCVWMIWQGARTGRLGAGWIGGIAGVLDRIDALLFAAPIYYVVLKYV